MPRPAGIKHTSVKKMSAQQAAKIAASFKAATHKLQRAGFKETEPTKSRIFTMTYQTPNAKGYVSIRYDKEHDTSMVLCEFFGRTKTLGNGIGIETRLIDITPRKNNVVYFKGLQTNHCRSLVVQYAAFLLRGMEIFDAMADF